MKKFLFLALSLSLAATQPYAKKTLDHSDFDRWEKVTNYSISNNGRWECFAVNPQEGDGTLFFNNTSNDTRIALQRGYRPSFTADGKWAFALIKPLFQDTRKAKIAKKKDFDLPQDSLAIIDLTTGKIEKIARVISYSVPEDAGQSVAWLSCDTTLIKPKALKEKKTGRPLVVRNLASATSRTINWVKDFIFSKDGSRLAVTLLKSKKDSLATNGVGVLRLADDSFVLLDRDKNFYGRPVFNEQASLLAYIASNDSAETGTKHSELYLSDLTVENHDPHHIVVEVSDRLSLNQYSRPLFSHNGKRLIVGVAPEIAPDDTTLVSFETPSLDIWRWNAPMTPPKENKIMERLRKQTSPVVIDLGTMKQVLVTSDPYARVMGPDRWDADWALVADHSDNMIQEQWNYQYPVKLYLKNIVNGERREVAEVPDESYSFSPSGKYVLWFADSHYHAFDVAQGTSAVISASVSQPLWDEDADTPLRQREPYGVMGWTDGDGKVLVYDRYDVIALDPMNAATPVNLTAGEGRRQNLKIRHIPTDPDFRAFRSGDKVLYSLFRYSDKRNGLATASFSLKPSAPKTGILDEYMFTQVLKAKNADVYSWIQGNFNTSPNVYVSKGLLASNAKKVSDSNPWMHDYNWGTARLFKWNAYDGKPSDGILFLPEDFDPDKKYPMIVYFYEIYSDKLYKHWDMEPSWSWINFPFYVSRGYAVFVPDVHFSTGIPGESSFNYVCSGVEAVCREYPNIDIKRVGIDGQSWGGYQTSYLVTRTNMFACAGSGAPVANMTSAFGGIRWGSGDSRQAQYEVGQSRIGRNLWETPELYIANSPLFHADRINTPLLIMHNDNDGAVPWYQGIEMFMALRRLEKPVWMLQYNGEEHNLRERRNRKDITRRLQQFFDHYLKGEPMPRWMKEGIPAVRKGQDFGY